MTINSSYNIDDKILNYNGTNPLNLYVKKTVEGDDTTYTVLPIRASTKLGLWLQEHSRFFNFIITWFISKKLTRDENCHVLNKDRLNTEPKHDHVLGKIIYRISRSTSPFFQDHDKENLMRNFFASILDNPHTTDKKKTEWIMASLTANGKARNKRAEILFEVAQSKNYFKKDLFEEIFVRCDDFDPNIQVMTEAYAKAVAQYSLQNPNEFNLMKNTSHLSWIIQKHYDREIDFGHAIVSEAEKQALALINGGPFTQDDLKQSIIPLTELMINRCGEDIAEAASQLLIEFRYWDNKNNFKVNTTMEQYDISMLLNLVLKSPERVLERFHIDCFSKSEGINKLNIIALNDSFKTEKGKNQADDKGGVSRQFIVTLFESLVKKSEKIAFSKGKTGFYIPEATTTILTKEEIMLYEAIGKLMGMCLTSKGYLLIGQIFEPVVYDIISKIYPHVLSVQFKDLNNNTLIAIYEAIMGHDEYMQRYRAVSSSYVTDEDLRSAYNLANSNFPDWNIPKNPSDYELRQYVMVIGKELKGMIVDETKSKASLLPIYTICQGIAKHYRSIKKRNEFNSPQVIEPEEMIQHIQGNFSKELVKDSLMFLKDEHNQIVEEYETIHGYFEKWIDESDEKQVRKFLMLTTGSKTIGIEAGIDINVNDYDSHQDDTVWPKSNTCTKQLTIQNYPNYDLFKTKLDEAICNAELSGMGFDKE